MPATAEDITALVDRELAAIPDARLARFIRRLLLKPTAVARAWNYGEPGLTYVCWVVLSHERANSGVAYYEFRKPFTNPWRAVQVSCPELAVPGDPGWQPSLLEAFVQSRPESELPATAMPQNGVADAGIPPYAATGRQRQRH
jgi:hypothetical protein